MASCGDRSTAVVRFYYGDRRWAEYDYCGRHSWPWRAGRGNGTAEVTWK